MSEKRITKEIMDQVLQAKSVDKVNEILKDYADTHTPIKLDESALVTGGTGRIPLKEAQLDQVVGGGHLVTCAGGGKMWVDLIENGYVLGSDPIFDKAYLLEQMAMSGFSLEVIINMACKLIPLRKQDVEQCIRISGPVYLATCYKNANGYSLSGDNL